MLTRFTTAPADYDGFGTRTVRVIGRDNGRDVREVEIDERHLAWQETRYGSGMHPSWTPADVAKLKAAPWFEAAEPPAGRGPVDYEAAALGAAATAGGWATGAELAAAAGLSADADGWRWLAFANCLIALAKAGRLEAEDGGRRYRLPEGH